MRKIYSAIIAILAPMMLFSASSDSKPTQERDLKKYPLAAMFYHDLYSKSLKTRERLLSTSKEVASHFTGAEVIVPPLKGFDRTKDKVDLDYEGDWKKITDVVRGSISFQNIDDLKKGVFLFHSKLPLDGIKDRIWAPTPSGYIDILALFKDPVNGIVGEVQFHLCHILRAKEKAHEIYERIQKIQRKAFIQKKTMKRNRNQKNSRT